MHSGCEDILQEELSPSTVLGILEWSSQPHGSGWVLKQAEQYLLEEFMTIVQTETFYKLPKKYLVKILQSDFLQVRSLKMFIYSEVRRHYQ